MEAVCGHLVSNLPAFSADSGIAAAHMQNLESSGQQISTFIADLGYSRVYHGVSADAGLHQID